MKVARSEVRAVRRMVKMMCTVFWDWKGILLIDFLPRGQTIKADVYCETLRKLRRAIQNKRRGLLSKGVVFLHDNARPHTANVTKNLTILRTALTSLLATFICSYISSLSLAVNTSTMTKSWKKMFPTGWRHKRQTSMKKVYKNLCHAMRNACEISAVMWKSSLRVVEFCAINNFSVSVHNLISLPNGTYFLDVPRILKNSYKK